MTWKLALEFVVVLAAIFMGSRSGRRGAGSVGRGRRAGAHATGSACRPPLRRST